MVSGCDGDVWQVAEELEAAELLAAELEAKLKELEEQTKAELEKLMAEKAAPSPSALPRCTLSLV